MSRRAFKFKNGNSVTIEIDDGTLGMLIREIDNMLQHKNISAGFIKVDNTFSFSVDDLLYIVKKKDKIVKTTKKPTKKTSKWAGCEGYNE
jgi:hypothetical protein